MKKLSLVPALLMCLLLCPAASAPQVNESAPQTRTLLTYNVGVFSKHGGNSLADVAGVIRFTGADAVSLNELDSCNRRHGEFQLEELSRALDGMSFRFAGAFPFAGGSYGDGVLCREEILRSFTLILDKGDGSEQRSASVVETHSMVFASTHLDYASTAAAMHQADILNEWFTEHYGGSPKPVFLLGDMNALPGSAVISSLEQCWERLSTDAPTFPSPSPVKCIDYVFHLRSSAAVTVLESRVLDASEYDAIASASDHMPVLVRVSW